jgi:hypothetical protein
MNSVTFEVCGAGKGPLETLAARAAVCRACWSGSGCASFQRPVGYAHRCQKIGAPRIGGARVGYVPKSRGAIRRKSAIAARLGLLVAEMVVGSDFFSREHDFFSRDRDCGG